MSLTSFSTLIRGCSADRSSKFESEQTKPVAIRRNSQMILRAFTLSWTGRRQNRSSMRSIAQPNTQRARGDDETFVQWLRAQSAGALGERHAFDKFSVVRNHPAKTAFGDQLHGFRAEQSRSEEHTS